MNRASDHRWLHRFAVLTAGMTLCLIWVGGLVTSHGVGMAVPDWPTSYGYNMFYFPISKWVGGIFYEQTVRVLVENAADPFRDRKVKHVVAVARRPIRHRHADAVARDQSSHPNQAERHPSRQHSKAMQPAMVGGAIHFLLRSDQTGSAGILPASFSTPSLAPRRQDAGGPKARRRDI